MVSCPPAVSEQLIHRGLYKLTKINRLVRGGDKEEN